MIDFWIAIGLVIAAVIGSYFWVAYAAARYNAVNAVIHRLKWEHPSLHDIERTAPARAAVRSVVIEQHDDLETGRIRLVLYIAGREPIDIQTDNDEHAVLKFERIYETVASWLRSYHVRSTATVVFRAKDVVV